MADDTTTAGTAGQDTTAAGTAGQDTTPAGTAGQDTTPAGTAGRPDPDVRRRRRQTRTFAGMLAGVLALGLLAFGVVDGTLAWPFGGDATLRRTACVTPSSTIQAAGVTKVRVLNASDRRGLALQTAHELQKRGFKVPEAPGNTDARVKGAALLRHGPSGELAAHTVATQVKGAVTYEVDDRLGELVDLVLGPAFGLVDAKAGAGALARAPSPSLTC